MTAELRKPSPDLPLPLRKDVVDLHNDDPRRNRNSNGHIDPAGADTENYNGSNNNNNDRRRSGSTSSSSASIDVTTLANVNVNSPTSTTSLLPSALATRWEFVKGLLLCQIVSALICGTAVFSTLLVSSGDDDGDNNNTNNNTNTNNSVVDIPTLQSFGNYVLLTLFYTTSFLRQTPRRVIKSTIARRWWKYLLIAAFDVEGNYLMVKAYRYTSITSVQLLDSVTIPTVLILSWLLLKYRYEWIHIGGVAVAMTGMGLMIFADVRGGGGGGGGGGGSGGGSTTLSYNETIAFNFPLLSTGKPHLFNVTTTPNVTLAAVPTTTMLTTTLTTTTLTTTMLTTTTSPSGNNATSNRNWLGDVLAVLGATCYGFSNVGQEYFVSDIPGLDGGPAMDGGAAQKREFLAFLGVFGALVNGVQFAALEWREAAILVDSASITTCLYILGFNLCLFAMYSLVPEVLRLTSAAVFNISILTSDFYTFLFGLLLFHLDIDPFYFLAYLLVILGIVVYSWKVVPHR